MVAEKMRRAIEGIEQARGRRPMNRRDLERWVLAFTGVRVPGQAVCRGHSAPLDMFARQVLERPALALWHGPRGSGKSFLSAIDTHIASRFHPRHETRILGGSLAQSEQIHQALREAVVHGRGPMGESDAGSIARLLKNEVHYHNGSEVSILAASATSVRGPHVPSLKLDEVDEIDPEIRESAMGMAMEVRGCRSSVLMTSTWHRVAGPMAELIDTGPRGGLPGRHVLRLRGPGALPRGAERAAAGELPAVSPGGLVPFGSRRPSRPACRRPSGPRGITRSIR